MTNSLVPKPFDVTDSKRAREEAARLAERSDGAVWSGVVGEAAAREELAAVTEAEAQATREAIVAEAQARADALIDVDTKLGELDSKYDGVITDAGQLGTRLETAEAELVAHEGRLDTADTELGTLTGVTLPALQSDLEDAEAALAPLPGLIAGNSSAVAAAQSELTLLKDTTVPALSADLTAAKNRLTTAEGTLAPLPAKVATAQADLTTAFGQLGTVDTRISTAKTQAATDATAKANDAKAAAIAAAALTAQAKADAAKDAAITAAALTSQAKADTAKSEALSGAATVAQQKADAAEAAALAAAKTYADAEASGAGAAALAAAKTDATTKANDAKAAAISAAALDATAKAAQAKTDATTIAANDATTKANNAQAAAIAAAALDATAKAGQAKTDAIASATTMTNGIGKNLSSTAAPTTSNTAPKGSMWRRTDSSGNIIGVWEQTGTGVADTWTPRLIKSETIDNLDVGKLSSSAAAINTAVINKLAVQIATVIELNADRITAGKVTSAQVDTANLAAALATILQLNADRITAGVINTARLNVAELAVQIATVIKLNASRITAGTIDTARLNVTTMAAALATVLQLNADRITAGTIATARLDVEDIAAKTAAFQTVDVKNLFATTGTMAAAVINKLWTDVVNSRKITTQMLAVGDFTNLIPNGIGDLGDNAGWASGLIADATDKPAGVVSAFRSTPGQGAVQGGMDYWNVEPGAEYLTEFWIKADKPNSRLYIELRNEAGLHGTTNVALEPSFTAGGYPLNNGIVPTVWTRYRAVTTTHADTSKLRVGGMYFNHTNGTERNATVWIAGMTMKRRTGAVLIENGAVTAEKMEAELVLATKIVAGDPAATHAEMSPLGFKVFASPAGGGTPAEVVRLGVAATDDYFAITKGDGTLVASISQDGVVVGDQLNATSALWYKGDEMTAILDRMPRGIVAAGYRSTSSTVNASYGNIIPYLRVEAVLYPGRIYKVWTSGIKLGLDAGTRVTVGIKFANNGNLATTGSNGLTETASGTDLEAPIVQELFAVSTEQTVSFLLFLQVLNSGQAGFRGSGAVPTRLVVEDAGPFTSQIGNGVHMNGTVAPPPAVNTYKKQYGSTGSMNYRGTNAQYNYDTGHMYQGLSPAGVGNTKSISIHPSMTADLSGATINYVRVYFNFGHWYYNAGGTARIGLHGHASIPGSFSGSGIAATSGGWPRPGARWVDLPSSVFAGFKSGAYKGVYLEGDGTYGTYGIADRPTIEIGYTK